MISGAISECAVLRRSVRDVDGWPNHARPRRRAARTRTCINCFRRSLRCAQGRLLFECSQKDRSAITLPSGLLRRRLLDGLVASNNQAARQIFGAKQKSCSSEPEISRRLAVIELRKVNHMDAVYKAADRRDFSAALLTPPMAIGRAPDAMAHRLPARTFRARFHSMQLTRTLFSFRIWPSRQLWGFKEG